MTAYKRDWSEFWWIESRYVYGLPTVTWRTVGRLSCGRTSSVSAAIIRASGMRVI